MARKPNLGRRYGKGFFSEINTPYSLARRIDKRREGRPVLYLPMEAGGPEMGVPLLHEFKGLEIPFEEKRVRYDREKHVIVTPTKEEYLDMIHRLDDSCLNVLWDDSTSTGKGLTDAKKQLTDWGTDPDDIVCAAVVDNVGITEGYCLLRTRNFRTINTFDSIRRELIERGVIPEYPTIRSSDSIGDYRLPEGQTWAAKALSKEVSRRELAGAMREVPFLVALGGLLGHYFRRKKRD